MTSMYFPSNTVVFSIQIDTFGICLNLILKHSHFNILNSVHNFCLCMYIASYLSLSFVFRSRGHSLRGLLAALSRSPPHVLLRLCLVRVSNVSSHMTEPPIFQAVLMHCSGDIIL